MLRKTMGCLLILACLGLTGPKAFFAIPITETQCNQSAYWHDSSSDISCSVAPETPCFPNPCSPVSHYFGRSEIRYCSCARPGPFWDEFSVCFTYIWYHDNDWDGNYQWETFCTDGEDCAPSWKCELEDAPYGGFPNKQCKCMPH